MTVGAKTIRSCRLDQGKMSPMVPVTITSCCYGQRSPSGFCSVFFILLLLSLLPSRSSAFVASGASLFCPFLLAWTVLTCLSKWSLSLNSLWQLSHSYILLISNNADLRVGTYAACHVSCRATARAPGLTCYCRPISCITVAWGSRPTGPG